MQTWVANYFRPFSRFTNNFQIKISELIRNNYILCVVNIKAYFKNDGTDVELFELLLSVKTVTPLFNKILKVSLNWPTFILILYPDIIKTFIFY